LFGGLSESLFGVEFGSEALVLGAFVGEVGFELSALSGQ
jgi:hypothetical protein